MYNPFDMIRLGLGIFAIAVALCGAAVAGEGGTTTAPYDVFQLRVEDDGLVLRTTMPATADEEVRSFLLQGIGGTAELVTSGAGGLVVDPGEAGRAVVPNYFKMEISDDDQPGRRVGIRVSWHDGALDIQHNVHYTGPHRYTRLTRVLASRNPEFGNRPGVQLMVNEHGNVGREPVEFYLREDDFVTMRRKHEAATDEHLRPLLRALGQEAVFAPEPRVARHVFPDRWDPDPAMVRAVERLLPDLDARTGDEREAASGRLAELGEAVVPALLRLDREPLSAEQNTRIDAAIAAHAPFSRTEAARRRRSVPFLLDCLNSPDSLTRAAGLDHLRDAVTQAVEFDLEVGVPARGAAVAELREQLVTEHMSYPSGE